MQNNEMNKISKIICPIALFITIITFILCFFNALYEIFTPICFFGLFAFFLGLSIDTKLKKGKDFLIWFIITLITISIAFASIVLLWIY